MPDTRRTPRSGTLAVGVQASWDGEKGRGRPPPRDRWRSPSPAQRWNHGLRVLTCS